MHIHPPTLPNYGQETQPAPTYPVLSVQEIINIIKKRCVPSKFETFQDGNHAVIILPEAASELDSMICYGKRRAVNLYEQHYLGLGHKFVDKDGTIITVVSRFLYIYSASRGPCHAKVISEGNDAMLDILEKERAIQNQYEKQFNEDESGYLVDPFLQYGPSEVVLFGHTHPGLGVFFSPTDHGRNYSTPTSPIVTFVCDPIQKDMKAMVGVKGEPAKIFVFRQSSEAAPLVEQEAPETVQLSTASRFAYTVPHLWQRIAILANLMLQQPSVNGHFDCYRDWRGNMHMKFRITRRKPRRTERS